jgi:hypothetical protein
MGIFCKDVCTAARDRLFGDAVNGVDYIDQDAFRTGLAELQVVGMSYKEVESVVWDGVLDNERMYAQCQRLLCAHLSIDSPVGAVLTDASLTRFVAAYNELVKGDYSLRNRILLLRHVLVPCIRALTNWPSRAFTKHILSVVMGDAKASIHGVLLPTLDACMHNDSVNARYHLHMLEKCLTDALTPDLYACWLRALVMGIQTCEYAFTHVTTSSIVLKTIKHHIKKLQPADIAAYVDGLLSAFWTPTNDCQDYATLMLVLLKALDQALLAKGWQQRLQRQAESFPESIRRAMG